jgi:thiosulfate reductase cytochrome b subunit
MDDTRQHDARDPSAPKTASPEASRPPMESERYLLEIKSAEQGLDATTAASQKGEMVSIVYKHSLATRWMHWINFPLLFLMIYSGILIYWADSEHEGLHAHQVYRIGIGNWTIFRFFPRWFYNTFHLKFQLAQGLAYHFFFMWFFALNGLAYVGYTLVSGEWRNLVPTRDSLKGALDVVLHDLGLIKRPLPKQKFNHAQRIAYTGVVLMGAASLLTGLAIYKPSQLHVLTSLLGGYEMARWFHFCLTLLYVVFFVVHIAQVTRAGWNNFRAMITGDQVSTNSKQKEASDEQSSLAG